MHKHFAADGDGRWVPIIDQRDAGGRTRLLRTTVHPDPIRSWAMATIVAVDLSAVDLHLVAGRHEPPSETKEARAYQRAAVVPPRHHPILIAAFNGGPPAKQGGYALRIDGVTLGRPRPQSCVIAKRDDASLVIRPWDAVRHTTAKMIWFRQTPACMVDRGEQHPASSTPTYGGGTMVTRRSAIGLDDQRSVLFVGMGDYCTAQAIAEAMHHAGAQAVAPLDANFSFPKLVFYRSTGRRELEAVPLNDSFDYAEDQYVGTPAVRDFFYLTRRSAR